MGQLIPEMFEGNSLGGNGLLMDSFLPDDKPKMKSLPPSKISRTPKQGNTATNRDGKKINPSGPPANGDPKKDPYTGNPITVAVDFDGTIADTCDSLSIMNHTIAMDDTCPKDGVKEGLEEFRKRGWKIAINTVRDDKENIANWMKEHKIPFDWINYNPHQPTKSPKLDAQAYIDNRSISARKPWKEIVSETIALIGAEEKSLKFIHIKAAPVKLTPNLDLPKGHQTSIAIDFDGTLVESSDDRKDHKEKKGKDILKIPPRKGAVEIINKLHDAGWLIIIWTGRSDLNDVSNWLKHNKIPFHFLNNNPQQETGSRKIVADVYLDDRVISAQQEWSEIYKELMESGLQQNPAGKDDAIARVHIDDEQQKQQHDHERKKPKQKILSQEIKNGTQRLYVEFTSVPLAKSFVKQILSRKGKILSYQKMLGKAWVDAEIGKSISPKDREIPEDQPFDNYHDARNIAESLRARFKEGIKEAAAGFKYKIASIKSRLSFHNKTEVRGKSPQDVTDVLRGAIIVKYKDDMSPVITRLKKIFTVKKIDSKKKPTDLLGYYGAVHLDIVLDGMICEIQVMPKAIWRAKKRTDRSYQKFRCEEEIPEHHELERAREIFQQANEECSGKEKSFKYPTKDRGVPCVRGERSDETGCTPVSGEVGNPSLEQTSDKTRTPQFKSWFGDWENDPQNSSKVVGEDGSPLVVYHGTSDVFDSFDAEAGNDKGNFGAGAGVFFTQDPEVAQSYANQSMTLADKQHTVSIDKAREVFNSALDDVARKTKTRVPNGNKQQWSWLNDLLDQGKITKQEYDGVSRLEDSLSDSKTAEYESEPKPNVVSAYLNIRKPKVVDANGLNWDIVVPEVLKSTDRNKYDGVIFKNIKDNGGSGEMITTTYFGFNPNKKKKKNNEGSFDPNNVNMYKSLPWLIRTKLQHGIIKEIPVEYKSLGGKPKQYKFGTLQLVVPDPLRKEISDWVLDNIPEYHLGPDGRCLIPHITIKNGFTKKDVDNTIETLKDILDDTDTLKIKLGKPFMFPAGKDGVPLCLEVESKQIMKLNKVVSDTFPIEDKFPDYKCHLTLAYLEDNKKIREIYEGLSVPFAGKTINVNSLEFRIPDGDTVTLPLKKPGFMGSKGYEIKDVIGTCKPGQTPRETNCIPSSGQSSGMMAKKPPMKQEHLSSMLDRVKRLDGGFTFQPFAKRVPSEGFALSPYPESSFATDASKLTPKDIVSFIKKNQNLLKNSNHYIGAWHDPQSHKVFLDVSVVSKDENEAKKLALEKDQIAYFDLKRGMSVTVNPEATSGGVTKDYERIDRKFKAQFGNGTWRYQHGGNSNTVSAVNGQGSNGRGVKGSPRGIECKTLPPSGIRRIKKGK